MAVSSMKVLGLLVLLSGLVLIPIISHIPKIGVIIAAAGSTIVIYSALSASEAINISAVRRIAYAAMIPTVIVAIFILYIEFSRYGI